MRVKMRSAAFLSAVEGVCCWEWCRLDVSGDTMVEVVVVKRKCYFCRFESDSVSRKWAEMNATRTRVGTTRTTLRD